MLTFVSLLIIQLSILEVCSCPDEWTTFAGSCYTFIDDKESWYNAEEVCRVLGGHLVEIENAYENDFLKRLARNKNLGGVWTGGHDLLKEGRWEWVKSRKLFTFTDWAPSEPYAKSDSRCVQLWSTHSYQWDDVDCDNKLAFVCETTDSGQTIIG